MANSGARGVGERPKEAAATCEHLSGGAGAGDARQQFQALQYVHPEVPETPQTSPTISGPSSQARRRQVPAALRGAGAL